VEIDIKPLDKPKPVETVRKIEDKGFIWVVQTNAPCVGDGEANRPYYVDALIRVSSIEQVTQYQPGILKLQIYGDNGMFVKGEFERYSRVLGAVYEC